MINWVSWTIRLLTVCSIWIGTPDLCFAQTRTLNANSPGFLRTWPTVDNWQVALARSTDNRLVCLIVTGKKDDTVQYVFGLEDESDNLFLFLADQNPDALSGGSIKVIIDNTSIGSYPIDKRKSTAQISSVRAAVPSSDSDKLLALLRVGGNVQFETDEATYSASLDGMSGALGEDQNCLVEAQALGTNG